MHVVEIDKYKVECHVDRRDLRQNGIVSADLIDRTPLGKIFIQKAAQICKDSTSYEWPHCAYSVDIMLFSDEIVLVFSERVEDFLYSLQQMVCALDKEQADYMIQLIDEIKKADQDRAYSIIREFEKNVKANI